MKYRLIKLLSLILFFLVISCDNTIENLPTENNNPRIVSEKKLVSVEIVTNGIFSTQTITNGVLRANSNINLSFKKNGTLSRVYCKNGQFVNKGRLLAQIDNNDEKLSVEKAKESLKNAELELNSLLLGFGGISGDTTSVSSYLLSNLKIQSGYSIAIINLKSANNILKSTYLHSPMDGIIANQHKKEYDIITSSETFCKIINNSTTIAEFDIMEQELSKIKIGQSIKVIPIAYDSLFLTGKIQTINPIVNKFGFIKINAEVRNPYYRINSGINLIDGMNIKVIMESRKYNVLTVPKSAIVLRSNKKVIFTTNNGRACWNYVETSAENSTHYLISKGLQNGDSVITKGNIHLAHDAIIQINNK